MENKNKIETNSNGDNISIEVHNCQHGEINILTKSVFCNRYREFCKFVCDCPIKNNK